MVNPAKKVEERIEKREKRIVKLQLDLKEEKNKLKTDKELLVHLKYDDVLKQMNEKGVSPDEALRALQTIKNENNEVNTNQSLINEGVVNYENKY